MGFQRLGERVGESFLDERVEAVLPPRPEDLQRVALQIDARLDPADQAVAVEQR